MPRYLISFDDGSMDHIPEADQPAVGESAHAVVREAKAAGVWIFGGGVKEVAPFAVLVVILLFRPYGLFGKPEIERV